MPYVFRWIEQFSLVFALVLAAALAGCVDAAGPSPAAHARHDEVGCDPSIGLCLPPEMPPCTATNSECICDSEGRFCCRRDANCHIADPGVALPTLASLRVLSARGPNPEGSFTTLTGERTLTLTAEVAPSGLSPTVTWSVVDDPSDALQANAFGMSAPNGAQSAADVPRQTATRWRLPHGSPLSARALAFRVVAELPADGTHPMLRDSVVVRQREVDVLRQEYADFGIPVPAARDAKTSAEVAGLTRFGWSDLNKGDYGVAVLTPVLLSKLGELDAKAGGTLSLSSVFRNPAHHRYHISVSGGSATASLSQHQYGTAVDIRTYRNAKNWAHLRDLAKTAGACAEPLKISTTDHVHADWRTGAPKCPPGW